MTGRGPGVRIAAGAALLGAVLALTGCANDAKGYGDAPVKGRHGEDSPATVYNMPDGFGNLATKCVGSGYRAYVTTNGGGPSNIQIVKDPACAG
jgi:hypothetical protein